jgi:phage host-nuclease inhibitor protein Gam
MARKRLPGTQFTTWDEVDNALRRIGELDRSLGMIEASVNEAVDAIKAQSKEEAAPLSAEKAGLEAAMKEFCEANRSDFAKVKTREMTFGSVGFRLSSRIVIKRVADTLQALKDFGLTHCIRVKEEADKEAMKTLDSETLVNVGAALKTENAFGYEVKLALELAEVS